jgi:hypothetical protein
LLQDRVFHSLASEQHLSFQARTKDVRPNGDVGSRYTAVIAWPSLSQDSIVGRFSACRDSLSVAIEFCAKTLIDNGSDTFQMTTVAVPTLLDFEAAFASDSDASFHFSCDKKKTGRLLNGLTSYSTTAR